MRSLATKGTSGVQLATVRSKAISVCRGAAPVLAQRYKRRGEVRGKRQEVRGKRQEVRGKRQEVRGKRQEARGKREEGRGKREDGKSRKT